MQEEIESGDEDDENDADSTDDDFEPYCACEPERFVLRGHDSLRIILERSRDGLLEALMSQFWVMTSQNISANVRAHANSSSTSSASTSDSQASSSRPSNSSSGKRVGHDEEEEIPEEDHERTPKKPRLLSVSRELDESAQFACRKHDPRKYNIRDWATCALTPHRTVARAKGHLYRHHRIHQCPRCKELFGCQEELDTHIVSLQGCDLKPSDPRRFVEGITSRMNEQIQCRKKAYPGQTEAERWQQMYQLIFPNEIVPRPYFEQVRDQLDDGPQTPDSQERVSYEQYIRKELPRFFRKALETAVDDEIRSLGDRLRSLLSTLLEEAQAQAFDNYHATQHVAAETVPAPFRSEQNYKYLGNDGDQPGLITGNHLIGILETFHEDESHTSVKLPQPAFQAFGTNITSSAELSLKDSEVVHKTAVSCKRDSMVGMGLEFEGRDQDVSIRQSEAGELNCLDEGWHTGTDNMDWNLLLLDFGLQNESNLDMET